MSDPDPSRKAAIALALLLAVPTVFLSARGGARAADVNFRRGDANIDASFDISDPLATFGYLFLGGRELYCHDAADSNDSGTLDLSDGIFSLSALFTGGPAPPAPGELACGPDPTPDALDCQSYDAPGCNDDPTPPAIPTGLTAAAGNAQVALDWADNTEPDLAGYNVYRSTTAGSGHVKLNGPPILSSSYTDSTAANEVPYYYHVTAVDADLEESLHSAEVSARPEAPVSGDLRKIGHVLDRLGYGPTQAAIERINTIGLTAYIEEQLDPASIDESGNTALNTREAALYTTITPSKDTPIVARGTLWSYLKGTAPPPANWNKQVYDPSSWAVGPTGIGYGDGDDRTILADMQNGYMSVYIRRTFQVPDPAAINSLIARVDYDDGFVMYLNGTEVARRNLSGNPPAYNAAAAAREAGSAEDINITSRKNLLIAGSNLIAIQVHNTTIDSSDLTMIP
ncbi:MAG TPA: hypothetical protein VMT52_16580, partial [Planctomycetota bacterium]|nr:hypothetical protein [Planctomycetota bacterium]